MQTIKGLTMNSKQLIFVAMMATLGNVLSGLSIYSTPMIPSISLGTVSMSLALDLSHLATFISAVNGPIIGGITGLVGGVVAAYQFGFSQGNYITGFCLPIGKALTGLTAGILLTKFNFRNRRLVFIALTLIAYIPEAIFTAILFLIILPAAFFIPIPIAQLILIQILVKASLEMVIMGIIMAVLMSRKEFKSFVFTK
jgi:hypothetical protein